jgi:hypothetical protein
VTSIVCLSRKPLSDPNASDPKVSTVLMDDEAYTSYPAAVLEQLEGATGCVWALGIAAPKDMNVYRRVNLEYVRVAAEAFAERLDRGEGGKFRFAYCSGGLASRDQQADLWWGKEGRMIRGECESAVVRAAEAHPDSFEGYVLRPWMVVKRAAALTQMVLGKSMTVRLEEIASALLETAVGGSAVQIEENVELAERGARALERLGG